ncbi:hypothetical protein A2685_00135 [Candidatus Woesebacteria bacterium RIFCSPHIGHO2_01_FULL_37_10]|uniref:DUF2292 domain-containing protein n=1 Tax=Candidatus Woesebacteria bacterium RIFCSPHIGHO2_01_FULL_37_10 TaxID=1802489 RepID=A0A1F7XWY6_9BACT|nr:MAG: hypothetical protein A2685_00135 [Candidatus Woesebacteria bacterium RIFCSPHIGHO2_01_FULL_37_10]
MGDKYSTKKISSTLIEEIKRALQSVGNFGSIEVYITKGIVSQITIRNIKKTVNTRNIDNKLS